jgi:hypothetical protein
VKIEDHESVACDLQKSSPSASGRKPTLKSRATEFRQRLVTWKQTPESTRPSLRALARELGTSHQLLKHYLDGLEEWEWQERRRNAKKESDEIYARATAEGRDITRGEVVRVIDSALLNMIARIRRDAQRGPIHPAQFKMLKLFVKQGFLGAEEVLRICSQAGLKKRKRFAAIVKDTPRHEGESSIAWVRRIWDECNKFATDIPEAITEELLEKCSRGNAKNRTDNLPQIHSQDAKSFRSVSGEGGNSARTRGEGGRHVLAVPTGISQ